MSTGLPQTSGILPDMVSPALLSLYPGDQKNITHFTRGKEAYVRSYIRETFLIPVF
jgi:hypothetical protein